MSLQIAGNTLNKVCLVDDDPSVRRTYEFPIEELDVEPVAAEGPLGELDVFIRSVEADAAVCDHHLTPNAYSTFNGAALVARWYDMQFPAILCTNVENAIDQIRPHRRRIPVLIQGELSPDAVRHGFEVCFAEFAGHFSQARRGWRTLVRVVDVQVGEGLASVYVVVPGWDPSKKIRLLLNELPPDVQQVVGRQDRLHARINIGADSHEDLFFEHWEPS